MIKKGDIVLHSLSGLYYICENEKQARWMNDNKYYIQCRNVVLPETYFYKSFN